ncbi:MAG: S-adenosyl-l-methionine hydroxide adenosyltransferase family protein [Gemmataceae bacterium]
MQAHLITLTTDFGAGSSYVAAMKGALLSVAPHVQIVDLTHDIPPQDLRAAALYLRDTLAYFPPATIHVVVVDPGVGSDRALLLIETAESQILAPDNGCWTLAIPSPDTVFRLNQPRFWRNPVSATFHGRDILAAVAGHLALGVPPQDLGEPATTWERIELPRPRRHGDAVVGEIINVDHFGNLISNIAGSDVGSGRVWIAGREIGELVRTYSHRPSGSLVALVGSGGFIEIAVVNGSAARVLQASAGSPVEVRKSR